MSKQKAKNSPTNHKKSLSRLMAIQIFYQYDFLKRQEKLEQIKESLIENYALNFEENPCSYREKIDENFLNNLITGLDLDVEKIDDEISQFLKEGWSLEKLDDVARQILRLSAFELKFLNDIPAKVIIDEYVDIAASFFDLKRLSFFNATLENLAKKFRAAEFIDKS
jgi:N utilization substance protein B